MKRKPMATSHTTIKRRRNNIVAIVLITSLFVVIGLANGIANVVVPCPPGDVKCQVQ